MCEFLRYSTLVVAFWALEPALEQIRRGQGTLALKLLAVPGGTRELLKLLYFTL